MYTQELSRDTGKDYISQLPDDILVNNILSRLTIEEAGRTGVLSSRWKHLWRFFSGVLNFDDSWISKSIPRGLQGRIPKFVDKVTQILQSLRSPSLEELKIQFDLNNSRHIINVDSWVEFAMKTRVKRFHFVSDIGAEGYSFPPQFPGSSICKSLTTFRLKFVWVTGEVIEHLLSECPLLEVLCVGISSCLGNLKISGPSLKLKYLELMYNNVKNIEISAINLISFKCYGNREEETKLFFKDVPRLTNVHVTFGESYISYLITNSCSGLTKIASQLKTLALDVETTFRWDSKYLIYKNYQNLPIFNNIKQLRLPVVDAVDDDSPLHRLIENFPSLHMLSVELDANYNSFVAVPQRAKSKHQCLRVVEIVGFVGRTCDVKVAMYLFEYAEMLEKIIIDPRDPYYIKHGVGSFNFEDRLVTAMRYAQVLERTKPTGAKLIWWSENLSLVKDDMPLE